MWDTLKKSAGSIFSGTNPQTVGTPTASGSILQQAQANAAQSNPFLPQKVTATTVNPFVPQKVTASTPNPFAVAPAAPVPTVQQTPLIKTAQAATIAPTVAATPVATPGKPGTGYWGNNGQWISGPTPQAYTDQVASILDGIKTTVKPVNFSLGTGGTTYDSSALNTATTREDVLNRRNQLQNDMTSGTNTSLIPTDLNLKDIASGVYSNSKFSPEEVDLMNQQADVRARIIQTNLAARRRIQQLKEDGTISPAQAEAFAKEEQRRSDAQLADLTAADTGDTLRLGVLGQLRGNNLTAYQNLASFFKPQEVSPGSQLINQFGSQVGGGTGVNPSTAASYASQLFNDDLKTGTQHLTPDGQVDTSYYYQRASQILSAGQAGTGTGAIASPVSSNGGINPSTGGGTFGLPPSVQPYVIQGADGAQYINEDKVPTAQRDFVKQQAAMNGVPYLTGEDISKFRNIEVTSSNLDSLQSVVQKVNSPGLAGRTFGAGLNTLESIFQTNQDISSFGLWRDTAINTIQALAGGSGSGFRLNQAEIDTATSNLPTIRDNLETANNKINLLRGFLGKWKSELLQGKPGTGVGTVVQTKAGAINTNW